MDGQHRESFGRPDWPGLLERSVKLGGQLRAMEDMQRQMLRITSTVCPRTIW